MRFLISLCFRCPVHVYRMLCNIIIVVIFNVRYVSLYCKNGSRYVRADYVNVLNVYLYLILGFRRFIFVVLANLVNNFIIYFNYTFYLIVAIFRIKDTILCLFDIQT